jgi:predicted nuclease with TOPRIM domain
VPKTEELEGKIYKVIEQLTALRRENQRLHTECESLQSHVAMLTGENNKAQKILAEYEQLRRKQEQVTVRVERALHSLAGLRAG